MGTTLLLFWMASAAAKLVQLINFNHNHTIFSFHPGQLHSLPQNEDLRLILKPFRSKVPQASKKELVIFIGKEEMPLSWSSVLEVFPAMG